MNELNPKHTNRLINESSPYLLQHAHNPVNWLPWGEEALNLAQAEDKPLLISIGYSACHWCHVMERECFEDEETASLMNEHFICIKVDREERPDIDQLYMTAVQLMSGQGGWPLNCFALPDGRPVYGGTYFPKASWQNILGQINRLYKDQKEEVLEYAEKLTEGIKKTELFKAKTSEENITKEELIESLARWFDSVDNVEGGPDKAPKFPLPNNYLYLLRAGVLSKNKPLVDHVHLTLRKMARGGIYDQIGGGFARYSTDKLWKVPHFEKMLYDNGQLLSLYSEAYSQRPDAEYLNICKQTAEFIFRELTDVSGYFYSALDADSEGIEGQFYTWTKNELQSVLSVDEYAVIKEYYNVNDWGFWEHDRYILLRREKDSFVPVSKVEDSLSLQIQINEIKAKLFSERSKRIRPGLDNKLLCSWNALMIRGLADCYRTFGDPVFLSPAETAAQFLIVNLIDKSGRLYRSWKNGEPSIHGFLEDYCFLIDALIGLYQASFNEQWLLEAKQLMEVALVDFGQTDSGLFYFTSGKHPEWVTRQLETSDNVIPASNSAMARNLYYLGNYFGKYEWINQSKKMLGAVRNELINYGAGYSNWGILALHLLYPMQEIVIAGVGGKEKIEKLRSVYRPNILEAIAEKDSELPIFEGRVSNELTYYLCRAMICDTPTTDFTEFEKRLNSDE